MIVAVTGGMGAGKSTVVDILVELGAVSFKADEQAKKLMHEDSELRKEISILFGQEAYGDNGYLNRPFIAQQVFNNPEKLQRLNALVHPRVKQNLKLFIKDHANQCVVYESALLKEEDKSRFDVIIFVDAPEDIRVNRVMKRSQLSEKEILERIRIQQSSDEFLRFSDFLVKNLELSETKRQIKNIYAKLNC